MEKKTRLTQILSFAHFNVQNWHKISSLTFKSHVLTSWGWMLLWRHHDAVTPPTQIDITWCQEPPQCFLSAQHSKKKHILWKNCMKRQKILLTIYCGRRSVSLLESPLDGRMSETSLEKVKIEREGESTAKSGKHSASHATSAVSDFRLEICLDSAKKKRCR